MNLTDGDLKKIENLIKANIEYLDARWERRFEELKFTMQESFRKVHLEIEEIKERINDLEKRIVDDIDNMSLEIDKLKKRLDVAERQIIFLKKSGQFSKLKAKVV